MKPIRTYISLLAISALSIQAQAQEDSIALETQTLVKETISLSDSLQGHKRAGNLFVGVDLFNPIMSAFTDKQGGQAMISYRVYKKWNVVAELGYEKNHYDELDWDVDVDGIYAKLGFNWFVSQDHQDASNGFYTGLRFAYAAYKQTINQYPIRTSGNQVDQYGSLPTANVSSYWVEIVGGARVKLLSNFYADVSIRPEIYIGSAKQEDISPLVIPGYGKDIGPINFSVFWGLTYKFF
jgi:hypothetical protein